MIKTMFRQLLRRCGFDLVRYHEVESRPIPILDLVLRGLCECKEKLSVVQVGAHDGRESDPLYPYLQAGRMSGVLIEPMPDMCERLRKLYGQREDVTVVCGAIASIDGQMPLYRIRAAADVPSWAQGIASLDRQHCLRFRNSIPNIEELIDVCEVPALTLQTLIRKYEVRDVDLLQVDVEGFDAKVVNWALDTGLRPGIINYECVHLHPRDRAQLKNRLAGYNYSYADYAKDTIAVRNDVMALASNRSESRSLQALDCDQP